MPVYSPINGSLLEPTNIENIYRDPVYLSEYIVNNNVVTRISSPASGGNLVRNSDGTYNDPYIGQTFSFDNGRNAFIPHYIPDDTVEPAHIEGDFLVGNNTGRRFEIDPNGRILTPEEISYQVRQGQDAARLAQMEVDGTIDAFLEQAMARNRKAGQELEQMRQDGTLKEFFDNLLNEKEDTKTNHILDRFDDIVEHIGEQSAETLSELLTYFNAGNVKVGNRVIEAYRDPLIASRLNARYKVLTGQDHEVFLERVSLVINNYMRSKATLMKIGGYFNDQYFTELENIQTYVDSVQEKENVDVKPQTLREYHQSIGIDFPDTYYEMEELKDKAEKGEITADELKQLCDIAFGAGTPEAQLIYDSMIQSGRVSAPEQTEETAMSAKAK